MENNHRLVSREESEFFSGPRTRWQEFVFTLKVNWNFIRGFRALHFIGPCVTVFGSARFKEENPHYQTAVKVGEAISSLGFTVMTGGGPGIMEAANRGAFESGGYSVGCNIVLPHEQFANKYLHKSINIPFFFVRKVLLTKYSYAFVVMPGGMGTLDELFESLTLIQTQIIHQFPVVLFGKEYHNELLEHIHRMVEMGTIGEHDLDLLFLTDSIEEMKEHLTIHAKEKFGLKKAPVPSRIFGEHK